ncbi:hypothetical protein BDV25DRAFT_119318 [Aspergillus avenaceus]|uniref:Uncharacterized protein n=1 Tax=Aspergillus avenaceus TaxID=36643 RepID=A0A5N6TCL4_ASPAV|nr:hypothetical protein BDV25DRAFT_119318 [Aspergillus avenaceus]
MHFTCQLPGFLDGLWQSFWSFLSRVPAVSLSAVFEHKDMLHIAKHFFSDQI